MSGTSDEIPSPEDYSVVAPEEGWDADPVGEAKRVDASVVAYLRGRQRRPAVMMHYDTWDILAPHLFYIQPGAAPAFKTILSHNQPDAVVFIDDED